MVDFSRRIAVITGGTGALGRAVSLDLLKSGANVSVPYRGVEGWKSLQAEAGDRSGRLTALLLTWWNATATLIFWFAWREGLAREVGKYDIRAHCVLPGTMVTTANRKTMPTADFSKWVRTEDVARVIHFC